MNKEKIIVVGIDVQGRIFVKPESKSFPYIYRAAMEVNWDEDKKVLFSPQPREWSYQNWFEQIINAVKNECNTILIVDENTHWENVNQNIKEDILQKMKLKND